MSGLQIARDDTAAHRDHPSRVDAHMLARPALALALLTVIGSVAFAGVGMTSAAGATQESVASACQLDQASPQAVIDQRERTQQRLGELRTLRADSPLPVDQSTIDRVVDRQREGNISYDRTRYRRACGHYQIALNQSEAALERLYTRLAEVRLASVEDHLATRSAENYDSMAMADLAARHEALATQTANVSSLTQARAVADKSAELQADTESQLPSKRTVQVASAIAPLWGSFPIALGFVLMIGATGAYVGRWTADTTDTETENERKKEREIEVKGRENRFDSSLRE